MSWQNNGWGQDDTINFGYPYREDAGNAASFDGSDCCTIWDLSGDYPLLKFIGSASTFDPSTAASQWKFSPQINFGYPYLKSVYKDIQAIYPRVDIPRPLMVYAPETRDFSQNGICALRPVSGVHEITFGQAGEITVVHPFDADGRWRFLQPNNIILAPLTYHGEKKPQAFRIYRRVKSMDSAGRKTLTVYARHVFYDMMYSLLVNERFGITTASNAIKYIFEHQVGFAGTPGDVYNPYLDHLASDAWYSRDGGATVKNYNTEIGAKHKDFSFQNTTLVDALIGNSESIAAQYGLELYVDNFYFSMYVHANNVYFGHVRENSFDIRYTFDMTNVSEDVNYTSAFTHLFTFDNVQPNPNRYGISIPEETFGPFARPKGVKFSYNNYDTNDKLLSDSTLYWDENYGFSTSYTAKYAPLQLDKSRDFIGQLDGREVGDTGTVRNESIGIVSANQKIIYKKTDLLTGITLEIKLGNAPASFTKSGAWSDTARSTPPSALEKQIEAMQA